MSEPRISKEIDKKIEDLARDYYQELKRSGADQGKEIRTMVSGNLDDGTPHSLFVKIRPNPINPRLNTGWKAVAEDRVWEISTTALERSKLL